MPASRDLALVLLAAPFVAIGFTGMALYGVRGDALRVLLSAAVFSTSFRALAFALHGRDLRGIFATHHGGMAGRAFGYSHLAIVTAAFLLLGRALTAGLTPITAGGTAVLFLAAYLVGHVGARGSPL